jgi:prephenate dehydrogenase
MGAQITIVGLGQIGSSIGLALKAHEVNAQRVGHDKDPQAAKESQRIGAVDDVKYTLPASVREAQIVILALPLAEVRETLRVIAPDIQDGALVLDLAPAKASVAAWAKELLPPGRHYIGLTPAINPNYLHETQYGVKAARADLFEQGLMVVNAPMGTPTNIFNLTMELVALFGAMPLLMDTTEADGVFSAMHVLPQLAAAALLDTTVDKPGWQEARKLAGRPYATVTGGAAFHDDMLSLGETALENRENIVRLLNAYITSLINLRDEIDERDRDALLERLGAAWRGRARWFEERVAAEWLKAEGEPLDTPSFGERMNQIFFGSLAGERLKQRK